MLYYEIHIEALGFKLQGWIKFIFSLCIFVFDKACTSLILQIKPMLQSVAVFSVILWNSAQLLNNLHSHAKWSIWLLKDMYVYARNIYVLVMSHSPSVFI